MPKQRVGKALCGFAKKMTEWKVYPAVGQPAVQPDVFTIISMIKKPSTIMPWKTRDGNGKELNRVSGIATSEKMATIRNLVSIQQPKEHGGVCKQSW